MSRTISDKIAVKLPATEAWKPYGTLQLIKHVQEALPDIISKIDVVEGDGAAGTVFEHRIRLEVIEEEGKEKKQCITRSTIEYELKEEAAANSALVSIQPLTAAMKAAADYSEKSYNKNTE